MGTTHYRPFARKARAILTEQDYKAAKKLLAVSAKTVTAPEEEERLEALLRELAYYDAGAARLDSERTIGLSGYVAVPQVIEEAGLQRRWTDSERERKSASLEAPNNR